MGFGNFKSLCQNTPVPLCPLVAPHNGSGGLGIEPTCYARSIDFANTIIFQGANSFVHIIALVMTIIMVLHVRSKFTAVGMFGSGMFLVSLPFRILRRDVMGSVAD